MNEEKFYSIKDFAQKLSITRGTVYALMKAGKIKAIDVGAGADRKVWRIPGSEINKLLDQDNVPRNTIEHSEGQDNI